MQPNPQHLHALMSCCWCRWSQPAIMAMRTCRIIGFPRLQAVTRWCAPVYCQAEIFQQGSVSRLFQPYEVDLPANEIVFSTFLAFVLSIFVYPFLLYIRSTTMRLSIL